MCQFMVSRGIGSEDDSFGELTGLLMFVTAGCPSLTGVQPCTPLSHPSLASRKITEEAKGHVETSWKGANPANMWSTGAAEYDSS